MKEKATGGTYYFMTEQGMAIAYDYDDSENTTRNSSKDRNIRDIISGTWNLRGATTTDNRIAILDNTNNKIHILDHNWNRVSGEDITLSSSTYNSISAIDTRWVLINNTSRRVEFWTFAGVEQTSERQSISGGNNYLGSFTDGTYIYFIDDGNDRVQRRTYTSTSLTTFINNLGTGSWWGSTSTPTRFVIINNTGDHVHFYNHSGTVQASEEINLPSGNYQAVMAIPN